jgi:hypothetical protein
MNAKTLPDLPGFRISPFDAMEQFGHRCHADSEGFIFTASHQTIHCPPVSFEGDDLTGVED